MYSDTDVGNTQVRDRDTDVWACDFFWDTDVCVCQVIHADNTHPPQNTTPPPPLMSPPHLGHLHYSSVVTAGLLAGAISQKYSANWLHTVSVLGHWIFFFGQVSEMRGCQVGLGGYGGMVEVVVVECCRRERARYSGGGGLNCYFWEEGWRGGWGEGGGAGGREASLESMASCIWNCPCSPGSWSSCRAAATKMIFGWCLQGVPLRVASLLLLVIIIYCLLLLYITFIIYRNKSQATVAMTVGGPFCFYKDISNQRALP